MCVLILERVTRRERTPNKPANPLCLLLLQARWLLSIGSPERLKEHLPQGTACSDPGPMLSRCQGRNSFKPCLSQCTALSHNKNYVNFNYNGLAFPQILFWRCQLSGAFFLHTLPKKSAYSAKRADIPKSPFIRSLRHTAEACVLFRHPIPRKAVAYQSKVAKKSLHRHGDHIRTNTP